MTALLRILFIIRGGWSVSIAWLGISVFVAPANMVEKEILAVILGFALARRW